ncbi:MAG TPA: hydrogenase iron-sulfur subunit [Sedimentisphaerales bacterium]|nr:hydrogenase iron-sulfur subunit [Sedimentisphaerales bacterium]
MKNRALKIYLFYCANSLDAKELSQCRDELKDHHLKVISLPCSGKVDVPYLVKAFETGADGVVIVTCELDQCRHLEGNMRAEKRAEAVDSLLEEIGAGTGRIAAIHVREGRIEQTFGKIKNFCTRINQIKPASATPGRPQ